MNSDEKFFVFAKMLNGEDVFVTPDRHLSFNMSDAALYNEDSADKEAEAMCIQMVDLAFGIGQEVKDKKKDWLAPILEQIQNLEDIGGPDSLAEYLSVLILVQKDIQDRMSNAIKRTLAGDKKR